MSNPSDKCWNQSTAWQGLSLMCPEGQADFQQTTGDRGKVSPRMLQAETFALGYLGLNFILVQGSNHCPQSFPLWAVCGPSLCGQSASLLPFLGVSCAPGGSRWPLLPLRCRSPAGSGGDGGKAGAGRGRDGLADPIPVQKAMAVPGELMGNREGHRDFAASRSSP